MRTSTVLTDDELKRCYYTQMLSYMIVTDDLLQMHECNDTITHHLHSSLSLIVNQQQSDQPVTSWFPSAMLSVCVRRVPITTTSTDPPPLLINHASYIVHTQNTISEIS